MRKVRSHLICESLKKTSPASRMWGEKRGMSARIGAWGQRQSLFSELDPWAHAHMCTSQEYTHIHKFTYKRVLMQNAHLCIPVRASTQFLTQAHALMHTHPLPHIRVSSPHIHRRAHVHAHTQVHSHTNPRAQTNPQELTHKRQAHKRHQTPIEAHMFMYTQMSTAPHTPTPTHVHTPGRVCR